MESVVEKQIHTPEGSCWVLPRKNNAEERFGILCLSLASALQKGRYMMGEVGSGGAVSSLCDSNPWSQEGLCSTVKW